MGRRRFRGTPDEQTANRNSQADGHGGHLCIVCCPAGTCRPLRGCRLDADVTSDVGCIGVRDDVTLCDYCLVAADERGVSTISGLGVCRLGRDGDLGRYDCGGSGGRLAPGVGVRTFEAAQAARNGVLERLPDSLALRTCLAGARSATARMRPRMSAAILKIVADGGLNMAGELRGIGRR